MKFLTPQQMEQFQDDGYLVAENFLSPAEVSRVKHDIERVCLERASMTKDADGFNLEKRGGSGIDSTLPAVRAGLFRKIQGAVFHVPAVKEVFTSKKMLDCMEDLIGPTIHYHSSKVMFKPPREGSAKPWHQDAAYWKNYEAKQITVWIAIDDAAEENGCVWAIPGSHKLGHVPHIATELQVEESRIDLKKAVPVPVKAGGLLIFHSLVLHMSKKNTSDKPRCAIICDYDPQPNPSIDGSGPESDEHAVWRLRAAQGSQVHA